MKENQTKSTTKDYSFYLNCSKEEFGKLYHSNAVKEKRLNNKLKDIENEIKKITKMNTMITKAMLAKHKEKNKKVVKNKTLDTKENNEVKTNEIQSV